MPPPAADERQALLEFLRFNQNAFFAVAYGLTDEQARVHAVGQRAVDRRPDQARRPVCSAAGWQRVDGGARTARRATSGRSRSRRPNTQDEYVMRDDETLDELLDELRRAERGDAAGLRRGRSRHAVPVPHDVPWFPQDVDFWSVRWVALHLIEELARHAGHGDIIRESIDGATMYELMAGLEGWPETDWIKPWKAGVAG